MAGRLAGKRMDQRTVLYIDASYLRTLLPAYLGSGTSYTINARPACPSTARYTLPCRIQSGFSTYLSTYQSTFFPCLRVSQIGLEVQDRKKNQEYHDLLYFRTRLVQRKLRHELGQCCDRG